MSIRVLKVGGSVVTTTAEVVLSEVTSGHDVCVVHGAGKQISRLMGKHQIGIEFVDGRRVTTPDVLTLARQALAEVNDQLCHAIGPTAIGLMGDEIGLKATQIPELGLVGQAVPSCPEPIVTALAEGLTPIVAPLALGPLNVNADEAAAALAVGLGAESVQFLTDVPGLLLPDGVVARIDTDQAQEHLDQGTFQGGIVPKLRAAISAANTGLKVKIGATVVVAAPINARRT